MGKGKKGDISQVFEFEVDIVNMEDYQWLEDHDPPPLIRPKVKKKEGEEVKVS